MGHWLSWLEHEGIYDLGMKGSTPFHVHTGYPLRLLVSMIIFIECSITMLRLFTEEYSVHICMVHMKASVEEVTVVGHALDISQQILNNALTILVVEGSEKMDDMVVQATAQVTNTQTHLTTVTGKSGAIVNDGKC